jgi:hypothetical protein
VTDGSGPESTDAVSAQGISDDLEAAACATRSRALGEPLFGTASVVSTWLLVEQPGAWPTDALESRRLRNGVGAALARKANEHRVRIVLIRRPGRSVVTEGSGPRVFVAHVRETRPTLAWATLDSVADVLDLNFGAIVGGVPAGFDAVERPMFCVCTHGAHDKCCATRGRPVAAVLADQYPDETWEVSHIGGDRFAANIACFPHGYYFGRVPPHDAGELAADYAVGRLRLPYLRGRVCYPMVVQAAEHFLRIDRAIDAMAALRLHSRARVSGTDIEEIRFDVVAGGTALVRIRVSVADPARTLTCRSGRLAQPPSYELVAIESEHDGS